MARILVIEDYESLQMIYKAVLEQEGHQVEVVSDGFAALEKAKHDKYDLIMVDLLLPHMSGMEFLQAFGPKQHPKTKIIICSNFNSPKFIEQANELGVSHHLTKSNLNPQEVADVVANTLKEP
ncbi:MAG TPA: response regulator [Candidatus Saccharimonas sp.]|nr:response regulator [Candidatus Saccharimonas sp.]